jgi:hypothetical protein
MTCRWLPLRGMITTTLCPQSLAGTSQLEPERRPHCVGSHCSHRYSICYSSPSLQRWLLLIPPGRMVRGVGGMRQRAASLTRITVRSAISYTHWTLISLHYRYKKEKYTIRLLIYIILDEEICFGDINWRDFFSNSTSLSWLFGVAGGVSMVVRNVGIQQEDYTAQEQKTI